MAGSGKRFRDVGYTKSKALLPVSGEPMVIQAARCMPPADDQIFIIREEHTKEKELFSVLNSIAKNVRFVVDKDPKGQLKSTLVAMEHYNKDVPIFVGSCDFGMTYDLEKYKKLIDQSNPNTPEVISWTFTQNISIKRNPNAWSYVVEDNQKNISRLSLKIPISDNPYKDFANTGSFTFKRGKRFIEMAKDLLKSKKDYKGELYNDLIIEIALKRGYKVASFLVDQYIGQ